MGASRTVRCGVIGHGGAFNTGHRHLTSMVGTMLRHADLSAAKGSHPVKPAFR